MASGESPPELIPDTSETSGETPVWATPQIGRRTPLPSNRACAISGILAALLDGTLLLKSGTSVGSSLIGALFVGVFVYGGMRLMTGARRKIRPDYTPTKDPAITSPQDSSKPTGAPKGGWANPTTAQKFARRITRITSNYGKRRPPRR
jgi:hypothetical protein